MATDPVCGMQVAEDRAKATLQHAGTTFYFCSSRCRERFVADPAAFPTTGASGACHSQSAARPPPPARPGAIYTCPMHPEVRQDHPGACPICGMALEPLTVTTEAEQNPELTDMTRRFWVCLVLTIPAVFLAMGAHIPGVAMAALVPQGAGLWLELALATPVVLWGGWPFFVRGWRSLVTWKLNMFTLIGLGVGVAYLYSLVATLLPGIFPVSFRSATGQVAVYFEAAAVIVTLALLGQVMELRARSSTNAAIKALLGLAPKTARRVSADGGEADVPLEQVQIGDRLRVRPGEKV
ncbi:MAG: heavy metal-binding domain-containing protein, partial [Gammaproteobacteria bacterium]